MCTLVLLSTLNDLEIQEIGGGGLKVYMILLCFCRTRRLQEHTVQIGSTVPDRSADRASEVRHLHLPLPQEQGAGARAKPTQEPRLPGHDPAGSVRYQQYNLPQLVPHHEGRLSHGPGYRDPTRRSLHREVLRRVFRSSVP